MLITSFSRYPIIIKECSGFFPAFAAFPELSSPSAPLVAFLTLYNLTQNDGDKSRQN